MRIDDADFCEDLIANDGAGNYFLVINFDIFFLIGREKFNLLYSIIF